MIQNEEKESCHYLAGKKLSALLKGITSKNNGDSYRSNCLHSFRTKNKIESGIVLPSPKDNILTFNHYIKSDKTPCIICADLESLIRKIDRCAKKIGEHIPCGDIQCELCGNLII